MCVGSHGGHQRESGPQELELQAVAGHLLLVPVIELRSYGRSASALSYGAVSPSPEKGFMLLHCLNVLLSWQKVLWSGAGYVALLLECLPNRQDVLSLIPSISNPGVLAYGRSLNA